MQVARYWRMKGNLYRLEGFRNLQDGSVSLQQKNILAHGKESEPTSSTEKTSATKPESQKLLPMEKQ
ncbi:MAG: hypothetical protein ABI425_03110 [Patescibacteria group bacterium]